MATYRTKRRTLLLGLATLALIEAVPSGCGGVSLTSPPTPQGRVKPGVVVLDEAVELALLDDGITLRLVGPSLPLTVGNVIVSGKGEGLIRRVNALRFEAGATLVTTTVATLTDVFEELSLSVRQDLPASAIQPSRATELLNIPVAFTKQALTVSGGGKAVLDGTINLQLAVEFVLEIKDSTIQEAQLTLTGSVTTTSLALDFSGFEANLSLWNVDLPTQTVIIAGVPVVLKGDISASIKASATTTDTLVLRFNGSQNLTGGLRYTSGSGLKPVLNASAFNGDTRRPEAVEDHLPSAQLAFQPLSFDASYKLYGVIGPYLSFGYPKYTFEITGEQEPIPGWRVSATTALNVEGGFRLSAWKLDLLDVQLAEQDFLKSTWLNTFYPAVGNAQVVVRGAKIP